MLSLFFLVMAVLQVYSMILFEIINTMTMILEIHLFM